MNKRVKELWEQAAKLETDPSWEGQTKFMEKFSELIVLECADIVENQGRFLRYDVLAKKVRENFEIKK